MAFELRGGFGAEGTTDPDMKCPTCGHRGLIIKKTCRPRRSRDGGIRQTTWYVCPECGRKTYHDRRL